MEIIDNPSQELKSRFNRVDHASHHLTQMLDSLLHFITLTLACKCKRKTLICRLFFTGEESDVLHNLYHLVTLCIPHMNWLFIVYDQDYGAAFNEIFLLLPHILGQDPSVASAWSVMDTESKIWKLERMLVSESIHVDLPCMLVEEVLRQVLTVEPFRSLAEIRNEITALMGSVPGNEQQSSSMACYLIMFYLAITACCSESISSKRPGS